MIGKTAEHPVELPVIQDSGMKSNNRSQNRRQVSQHVSLVSKHILISQPDPANLVANTFSSLLPGGSARIDTLLRMEDAQEHIRRAMFEREELPCGQLQIIEPSNNGGFVSSLADMAGGAKNDYVPVMQESNPE